MTKNQDTATEVATVDNTNHALAVASDFEADASGGFEQMGHEDRALPFLRALTSTSPEIGVVEGALPGHIYNTVTGELHKNGITVICCAYTRQYIEWAPRGQGSGAPVNVYPATSDILSRTHREPNDSRDYLDNGNYIENTANHYVMALDGQGFATPALITMKSTQLKRSRKWNSMMMSVKMQGKNGPFTPPMYSQLYRLTTTAESNDKGKWYSWEIERIGTIENMSLYAEARDFAMQVKAGSVVVKHDADEPVKKSSGAGFADEGFAAEDEIPF